MSSTCDRCGNTYKNARGVAIHKAKCKAVAPATPIIAPQEAIASPAAEINIPAIIYAESADGNMDTDVSYESDSEQAPIISEPTCTLKTMREKYPTCHYVFQLEELNLVTKQSRMGTFHGFEDIDDAYRWFVPYTRDSKMAVHCVKDPKKPMKIMLDIDIPKSGGHMEEHKQIARDACNSLNEELKEYGQEKVDCEISRNIRDDKVGYHVDTNVAVDNKAAYGVIIDAIKKRMKAEYRDYLDPVPGNNMRMPFTHKKGIQLLPTTLDPSKTHTITRELFELLVPTNTEECVILDVVIPVQPKSEHVEITDSHVAAAEVIINDYFSKLGHKLNFWWSETRFHVPSGQHCPVCNEVHHSQNNYINISKNGTPWYNCRQKRGEGLPLATVKKPIATGSVPDDANTTHLKRIISPFNKKKIPEGKTNLIDQCNPYPASFCIPYANIPQVMEMLGKVKGNFSEPQDKEASGIVLDFIMIVLDSATVSEITVEKVQSLITYTFSILAEMLVEPCMSYVLAAKQRRITRTKWHDCSMDSFRIIIPGVKLSWKAKSYLIRELKLRNHVRDVLGDSLDGCVAGYGKCALNPHSEVAPVPFVGHTPANKPLQEPFAMYKVQHTDGLTHVVQCDDEMKGMNLAYEFSVNHEVPGGIVKKITPTIKPEIAALFPNSADDLALPSAPSDSVIPSPTYKAFDASDPYCWVDFEREFGMMKFASWDECIAKTTPCLNRVLAFVSQSTSYFVRKTNTHTNLYDVIPNSAKNFTNMKFTVVDDRKRDCRYSFNEYIGYADPYINKYKSMDFKPNMPHTEELFNMWQGYAAKDLGDEALNADSALAESKLAPLLTFIREIICDSNKETYDYLMQWLSFVLFRPEIAPGILLLLYSQRHGAGKDTFLTFVWKYLIGPHMAKELSCMNELMEKHNGWRARCKMVSITDMGATKEEWRANFTKLNGMITQSRVNINPKGQQQYDIDNIMAYTASTNYLGSMLISESDRRMFVVSVNQSRIGDQAYWDDFNEKVMNQDMGNLFYTYMRKNHGTPLRKLPTPPLTELKKEMIEASLPSPMAFLRDYLAGIRDAHAEASPEAPPLTEHRVASSTLYTEYVRWCADNNERALSCKVFSLNIKEKYPNAWKKLKAGKVFDFAI